MTIDTKLKWLILVLTVAVDGLLLALLDMQFPIQDLVKPLFVGSLLGAAAYYYRDRSWQFVLCLTGLMHITLFTSAFSVLMYCGGAIGQPFVDADLAAFDRACGVHLPSIVTWANQNPSISRMLEFAYHSVLLQTPLVIVVLGFRGKRMPLEAFVLQFMLGTLVTAIFFAAVPAEGPFAFYGYETNEMQARYLEHLHELRSGDRTVATWRSAEGLITFPSFHTTWAILLAYALRGHRFLSGFVYVVNGMVVLATMTLGWHYFADVVAGGVVAAFAISLSAAWQARTNSARELPSVVPMQAVIR